MYHVGPAACLTGVMTHHTCTHCFVYYCVCVIVLCLFWFIHHTSALLLYPYSLTLLLYFFSIPFPCYIVFFYITGITNFVLQFVAAYTLDHNLQYLIHLTLVPFGAYIPHPHCTLPLSIFALYCMIPTHLCLFSALYHDRMGFYNIICSPFLYYTTALHSFTYLLDSSYCYLLHLVVIWDYTCAF